MRKITKMVSMELVVPSEYHIRVRLNGDSSELLFEELYGEDCKDILNNLLTATVALVKALLPEAIVKRKRNGISLFLQGSERQVISFLADEFSAISCPCSSLFSLPSYGGESRR